MFLNTTEEEWAQAREDYQTLCQWLRTTIQTATELRPQSEELRKAFSLRFNPDDFQDPDFRELWDTLFHLGGFVLVPLVLPIRYYGYGSWLDQGIA